MWTFYNFLNNSLFGNIFKFLNLFKKIDTFQFVKKILKFDNIFSFMNTFKFGTFLNSWKSFKFMNIFGIREYVLNSWTFFNSWIFFELVEKLIRKHFLKVYISFRIFRNIYKVENKKWKTCMWAKLSIVCISVCIEACDVMELEQCMQSTCMHDYLYVHAQAQLYSACEGKRE